MTDATGTSEQQGTLPLDEPVADGAGPGADGHEQDADRGAQETAAPGSGTAPAAPYETPEEQAARIGELTADLQRLQAEYVNYKRRVDRDRELVLQNAKYSILAVPLPVLDDVDRAREHE